MPIAREFADRWRARLLSTEPVDHAAAESAIRRVYTAAELLPPERVLWYDSPLEALWAFAALVERQDQMIAGMVKFARQRTDSMARLKSVQESTLARLGVADWPAAEAAVGRWQAAGYAIPTNPQQLLPVQVKMARVDFVRSAAGDSATGHYTTMDPAFEPLQAEERQVFGHFGDGILAYGALYAGAEAIRSLMGKSSVDDYGYTDMARDEELAGRHGTPPPDTLAAVWQAAADAGLWWPFSNIVIAAERPIEIQRGAKNALTMVYRDGWKAQPYSKPTAKPPSKPAKTVSSSLIGKALPRDHAERIAFLRKQAKALPHFDRYLAGEHEKVWRDLVALGAEVRTAAHAADALAVAYETMHRAGQNIRTIVSRLEAMHYRFETEASKHEERRSTAGNALLQFKDLLGTVGPSVPAAAIMNVNLGMFEKLFAAGAAAPAKSNVAKPY
ncbi:MAG: hypothetical protein ABI823_20245, partial [Bryobacteraceae bacterium]